MPVKVVTDSSADLPPQVIQELGITVVPLYIRFGTEVYRDRVDITEDEFYRRLEQDKLHPSTVQPSPQDFVDAYQRVCSPDGVVSIHISGKLSGTMNSALQAKKLVGNAGPIEVIDSQTLTMSLGLTCILAARLAREGKKLEDIAAQVKKALAVTHLLGLLDTLKYVALGGRIGKAKAMLGSMLNVKPLLSLQQGEVQPVAQVRTRQKGIERLVEFVKSFKGIEELAVVYNTTPQEAQALVERLGIFFDPRRIYLARVGPMLGVHMGPGALVVALREKTG